MKALLRILGFVLTLVPLILVGNSFQFKLTFILILEIISLIGWEFIVVRTFVEDEDNFIRNLVIFICLWPLLIVFAVVVHHLVFWSMIYSVAIEELNSCAVRVIELIHSAMTCIEGCLADNLDLEFTVNQWDLEQVMLGAKSFEEQIGAGVAKVKGDPSILKKLAATMVEFDPRFEILPGTKSKEPFTEKTEDYEAVMGKPVVE